MTSWQGRGKPIIPSGRCQNSARNSEFQASETSLIKKHPSQPHPQPQPAVLSKHHESARMVNGRMPGETSSSAWLTRALPSSIALAEYFSYGRSFAFGASSMFLPAWSHTSIGWECSSPMPTTAFTQTRLRTCSNPLP
jgi:hypothetical protein